MHLMLRRETVESTETLVNSLLQAGAYLSLFPTDSCTGETEGLTVPLNQCFAFSQHVSAVFTCASLSSNSPWTVELFDGVSCNATSSLGTTTHSGACDCNLLQNLPFEDDYIAGSSVTLNCGSSAVPASCRFHPSSSSHNITANAIVGIVVGVVGFVLVAVIVALYAGKVISCSPAKAATPSPSAKEFGAPVNPLASGPDV